MASEQVREIVAGLKRFGAKVVVKLAFDFTANMRASADEGGTPVDTGWARANWIPSIGASVDEPTGSREQVSTSSQDAGLASLGGYSLDLGLVYVSNPVPYIQKLNDGWSPQAPPLFVERGIEKAVLVDALGLSP